MAERRLRVVLVGNYRPDAQESMLRYATSLARDLAQAGVDVRLRYPPVLVGRFFAGTARGLGKWAGYVDKFLLFPIVLLGWNLASRLRPGRTVFHVADHSNGPWVTWLPRARTVVTCHDVIAIRGSLGHADAHFTASRAGRLLQRHILRGLLRARFVVCVSEHTLGQLRELEDAAPRRGPATRHWVVPNSFNADFTPLPESARREHLAATGVPDDEPFLLHVGSDQARKNRGMLVDLTQAGPIEDRWQGLVVFAGAAVDRELRRRIEDAGVADRAVEVVRPTHEQLVALYQSCTVFIFPSFSEGFGWPVIEAQAAGAPVVASCLMPMPEVGGDGALYADPEDAGSFAGAVARLADPFARAELVAAGRRNIARFENVNGARGLAGVYRLAKQSESG